MGTERSAYACVRNNAPTELSIVPKKAMAVIETFSKYRSLSSEELRLCTAFNRVAGRSNAGKMLCGKLVVMLRAIPVRFWYPWQGPPNHRASRHLHSSPQHRKIARVRTIRALITGQLSSIWPQLSPASGRLPKRARYFRAQAARGCKQRLCVSCVVVSYHWTPFRQQHTQGLNWVLCARLLSDIILHPMPLRSGPTFWSSVVAIADNQIQQQLSRYETNFEPVRRYKFATASWSLGCKSTSFITL
jgi:hypothetical protein